MPLLDPRDLVAFPSGDNDSSTVINGINFNLTALHEFNYALYSNGTISNESKCYLIFDSFQPSMFDNGSWVNATTCYIPYYSISARGKTSIAFGVLFGMSIMLTLMNLKKHGQLHLREDKRFRVVGRRWQWYWMLFVAACGMISTLTGVDVDRYYLQQIPIVLQSLFFTLMVPGALAMVWEATRHWGSWQERQLVDADPFGMSQNDRRASFEFYIPLVFYLFAWLNFFMTIPRSWTPLQKQNTPFQKEFIARPAATNTRGKAGAIIAVFAWLTIIASLWHSLKHYKPRERGLWNKVLGFCRDCPTKLFLCIVLLAIRVGYGIAAAWIWDLSIFRDDVQVGWPFGLGYAPILLIIVVLEIAGFVEKNEDRIIISQRVARGQAADASLNLVKKPNWWSRVGDRFATDDERLRNMAAEVTGPRPRTTTTGRAPRTATQTFEMGNMNIRQRSSSRPPDDPFRDESPPGGRGEGTGVQRLGVSRLHSDAASAVTDVTTRTDLTGQTLAPAGTNGEAVPQQRIRSMLDV